MVITLSGSILFKTDEATLLPIARDRLDQVAAAIADTDDDQVIIIEGHTDSRGSASHNERLSQQRADTVRSYLLGRGVPAERVIARGRGERAERDSRG